MPFVDQKEKRASVLDEPYAAGIILTLRDRDINGDGPLTLSGVKHTVSANYNSVKKLLIWMEDMGILEINKNVSVDHLRPGRPGHNVELTEKGKSIADSLNSIVIEIGEIPNYRKNAKGKAKVAAPKAAAKPAPKAAAKPAAKAKVVAKAKPAAKAKPKAKAKAKAAPKAAAKPAAKAKVASKPAAKKAVAKKAPAKKTSSRKVKK